MTTPRIPKNRHDQTPEHGAAAGPAHEAPPRRRLPDRKDEAELELAIQASTSRIVSLALAQGSLVDDSGIVWEEGQ
jgi:hypothetical protein